MKTILNFIITTFGVLFILSACGGGGVTVGLVNQTCTSNAFSDDCGTSGQATRTTTLTDCVKDSGDCADNIPEAVQTCLTDLFGDDCDAVAETIKTRTTVTVAELQMTFCEANPEDMNCKSEPTLAEVCTGDPFNSRCLAEYNGARENACRANNTLDCGATITRFCVTEATPENGNTLNSLCADVKYNGSREAACRTGNHTNLCDATITRFCVTEATPANGNTLNSLCADVKYNTPREVACRTGNHANLCSDTITRFCTTNPTLDTYFDPLCVADTTAIMERNNHCKDTTNNNANPFSMRCVNNAMGLTARNNYCGTGTDATSPAFTDMRCADNTKGIEVRNAYCVMGGIAAGGNAFKTDCALNPDGNVLLLTASACMDAMDACLPSLRIICEAEVASFNTLCGNARTTLCIDGALLTDSLCNAPTYEMGRETACVNGVSGIDTECNTLYTKHCGAGAENPFDTMAGETGMINCLEISSQTNFASVRQTLCGNSRPAPGSKFETECNSLIVNLCTANPYDPDAGAADYNCFMDDAFIPQRSEERKTCRVGTAADEPGCADLVARDPCIGDPFYSTCDPEEYKAERTARESYCLSGVAGRLAFGEGIPIIPSGVSQVDRVCGTFRIPICSWDGMSEVSARLNPTARVCPNNSQTLPLQSLFCSIGNNFNKNKVRCMQIDNSLGGDCVINPFNSNYQSICIFQDANLDDEMRRQRVKFCSGDVADEDLNLCTGAGQTTENFICESSGVHANPFASLCARVGTDFDMERVDFLANCRNSDTSVLNGATTCAPVLACVEDAFGADCVDKRAYSSYRQTIVDECDMLDGTFTATCTQPIKESIQACLTAPYSMACKDNPDYDNRRTARLGECQGLTGSDAIRTAGGDNETKCRPAFDVFCTGDNLFATTGANCFGDNNYKPARDLHFAECKKATSARVAGTDCTLAVAQICQAGNLEYTDPFVPLCTAEGGRNSLIARQAVIAACRPLGMSAREAQPRCETVGANRVLDNCDNDPLHADCVGYNESDGLAYFDARASRLSDCAAEEGPTNHQNTCTGAILVLCDITTIEAVPFAPVCNNESGIATNRNSFLVACMANNYLPDFCKTASINAIRTGCADTNGNDPYNTAVTIMGSATLNCNDFDFFNGARGTRLTGCSNGTIQVRCQSVKALVCRADGTNANPFNTNLCTGDVATLQRDFCQIRANVGNAGCTSGDLSRPTTASVLAARGTELGATPTSGTNQTNEFLKGTDDGLNTDGFLQADGAAAEVITINMADAEYDNMPLGGDSADGIAFFVGHAPDNSLRVEYYAGILAGADLGAVLEQEVGATVNWYGAINWAIAIGGGKGFAYHDQTAIGTTTRDFVLEIDLGTRKFRSFFQRLGTTFNDGAQGFLLTGDYDATTGVIMDGKVLFGEKSGDGIARNGAGASYHFEGPLIGIIGAEGALGVFYAQRSNDGQGDALGGGFVARAPRPDFISWTRQAVDPAGAPLIIRSTAGAGDGMASFIRGGTGALDVGGDVAPYTFTLADDYSRGSGDIVTLGGQVADGVSFAVNGARLYSGLLAGTDVGAPLIADVRYQGLIGILIHKDGTASYDVKHDFTLNADFTAGTFNTSTATLDGLAFTISGGKFNQFGLISGTVTLGTSSGTLSGVIGSDGVVGSFISTTHTDGAFAGGFVARATTAITSGAPRVRETPIWRDNAVMDNGTRFDVLAGGDAVVGGNPATNFIVGDTDDLDLGSAQNITPATLKADDEYTNSRGDTIRLNGESADGVAFARATVVSSTKWYAGLLAGTSLGDPVSHTAATAQWVGQVGLIKDSINSGNPHIAPLVLTVNFKERKISSRAIAIFTDTLTIDGRYDGHGLIRGTVSYATAGQTSVGHLTGLIGDGISSDAATAVGAFVSGASGVDLGGYAGGFVARPLDAVTIIARKVVFGDWTHSFGDTPPPTVPDTTATPRNQFLQGSTDTLPTTGLTITGGAVTPLNLAIATFDGIALGGQAADGVGFFQGTKTGGVGSAAYAGIFNGTDLGAPLIAGSEKAYWNGQFVVLGTFGVNTNFTLEVDFIADALVDGSVGSIDAFVQQAGAAYYHLEGTYDSNGVIKGEVDFGNFTVGTRTKDGDSRIPGTLTGLIGQDGAVGAFISGRVNAYSGGFVANETVADRVRFIDWTRSFGDTPPDATPNTTFTNQFLQGTDTTLTAMATGLGSATDGTGTITPDLLNLATSTYGADLVTSDPIALGGDAKNGMGFFRGYDNAGVEYYYAGIFNGADLGAPLSDVVQAGEWKGRFGVIGTVPHDTDFTLEVTFGADDEVPGSAGKVEAFVQFSARLHYHLTGTYDRNGVISGKVDFGHFNAGTRVKVSEDNRTEATVRGLIGQAGAIGVFINDPPTTTTTLGGFAGGFVACPYDTANNRCKPQ